MIRRFLIYLAGLATGSLAGFLLGWKAAYLDVEMRAITSAWAGVVRAVGADVPRHPYRPGMPGGVFCRECGRAELHVAHGNV